MVYDVGLDDRLRRVHKADDERWKPFGSNDTSMKSGNYSGSLYFIKISSNRFKLLIHLNSIFLCLGTPNIDFIKQINIFDLTHNWNRELSRFIQNSTCIQYLLESKTACVSYYAKYMYTDLFLNNIVYISALHEIRNATGNWNSNNVNIHMFYIKWIIPKYRN